jgi:hypothetical protein
MVPSRSRGTRSQVATHADGGGRPRIPHHTKEVAGRAELPDVPEAIAVIAAQGQRHLLCDERRDPQLRPGDGLRFARGERSDGEKMGHSHRDHVPLTVRRQGNPCCTQLAVALT